MPENSCCSVALYLYHVYCIPDADIAYAIIEFEDRRDAEESVARENNRVVNGQSIIVEMARGRRDPKMLRLVVVSVVVVVLVVMVVVVAVVVVPTLWPSGKDTRSEIGRYGFDPWPSQTKDFKIGISR
ncbi:splicing factor, arginine/serine-rich 4/5/6 [Elysia marginata]|uniref:Splicing factor, arginine/serine-rich 4/5/6 n=1 Tax=Elysia marginata TaxID=1093978 RepID=A0AAV4JLK9_9GAST|nr:splicing factor, arginine/serine-rich 4/5/6 [Elysia marginata]